MVVQALNDSSYHVSMLIPDSKREHFGNLLQVDVDAMKRNVGIDGPDPWTTAEVNIRVGREWVYSLVLNCSL